MSGARIKEHIFHEDVRLFSKNGYENISLRSITKVMGINESTAYDYYGMESYGTRDGPRKHLIRLCWDYVIENNPFIRQAFRIVCME